jgi:DNA-binding NarL/FixJ family response regulator
MYAEAEPTRPPTRRQREVLALAAAGLSYREIAVDLRISWWTVRQHFYQMYGRIGVHDRTQAVLLALRRGWI